MLKVNSLSGFGSGSSGIKSISELYFEKGTVVNNNTWTKTGVSFGDTNPNRYIIAVIHCYDDDWNDATIGPSVTIGGITANILRWDATQYYAPAGGYTSEQRKTAASIVAYAKIPTGSSGNIVTTLSGFGGVMDSYSLAVYRATNINTSTITFTGGSDTNSITMVVPDNGFSIISGTYYNTPDNLDYFTNDTNFDYSIRDYGAVALKTVSGSETHTAVNAGIGTTPATGCIVHSLNFEYL